VVGQLPPRSERRGLRAQDLDFFLRFRGVTGRGRNEGAALGPWQGPREGRVEARDEVSRALLLKDMRGKEEGEGEEEVR